MLFDRHEFPYQITFTNVINQLKIAHLNVTFLWRQSHIDGTIEDIRQNYCNTKEAIFFPRYDMHALTFEVFLNSVLKPAVRD